MRAGARPSLIFILAVLVLAMLAGRAIAAAGDLDPSFAGDGRRTFGFPSGVSDDSVFAVAIQPDGKIVTVGYSRSRFAIARLNPGGGLDPSFSGDGRRTISFGRGGVAQGVAIQPDGKIVAVGTITRRTPNDDIVFAIARLRPNGDLDPTFAGDGRRTFGFPGGGFIDHGHDVVVQRSGKIVVGGYSHQRDTARDFAVARLLPDGSFDPSFSGDGRLTFNFANGDKGDSVNRLAIDDGKIVLAGYSQQPGVGRDFAVARLTPGGAFDTSFSGNGRKTFDFANGGDRDEANDLALQRDGRIVVAGFSRQGGSSRHQFAVARLGFGGGLDQSFSDDGRRIVAFASGKDDIGKGVAIQSNGKIIMAGIADFGGAGDVAVARLHPGGSLDQSFSGNGKLTFSYGEGLITDLGNDLALQRDGKIIVAGDSFQAGAYDFAVARLLGN